MPKLLISVASVALFLCALEAGLRIAAGLNQALPSGLPRFAVDEGAIVACYGDSYTYGLGAGPGSSYPVRLGALLKDAGYKAVVVNCGIPGSNTRRVLGVLQYSLPRPPAVALVMTGYNNSWNFEGLEPPSIWGPLASTRIARLLRIFVADTGPGKARTTPRTAPGSGRRKYSAEEWDAHWKKSQGLIREGRQDEARAEIQRMLDAYPDDPCLEKEMATFAREAGDYALARVYAGRSLCHSANEEEEAYARLELLYLDRIDGKWREALDEMARTAIDADFIPSLYPELKLICERAGFDLGEEAGKVREAITVFHGARGARAWDGLVRAGGRMDLVRGAVARDLENIRARARAQGTRLVLLTYPFPAEINQTIRAFAARRGVLLVDTELLFAGKEQKDYFAADGHCNTKGYAVIAEAAYKAIISHCEEAVSPAKQTPVRQEIASGASRPRNDRVRARNDGEE